MSNPFELYDLDPRDGIGAITERLKQLAEDAPNDAERERIRAAWEELTLHPARRLKAAVFAHPETRAELGSPPPLAVRRVKGGAAQGAIETDTTSRFEALAPWPSLLVALEASAADPSSPHAGRAAMWTEDPPLPLDDDPCLPT